LDEDSVDYGIVVEAGNYVEEFGFGDCIGEL
jgi:hypothetical protein